MVLVCRPPRKDYARTVPDSVGVTIGDLHASCFWKVLGCCRASIAAITENPWTLWSKRVARLSPAAHGGLRLMASVSAAEPLPLSLKPTDAAELTAQDVVVHFGGLAAVSAGIPPYPDARRGGIARALMLSPAFVLLDEPAAGMSDAECDELMHLVSAIPKVFTCGVLLIEHNMRVVMGICDRIHVLDSGRTIAERVPQEIQGNETVIAAYLGRQA